MPQAQRNQLQERAALRMLTSGLYVVTTSDRHEAIAATVSWITQVSIEPKLVTLAAREGSRVERALSVGRSFVINILGQSQQHIAKTFFKCVAAEHGAIGGYRFALGPDSCPILIDAPAWIACDVIERYHGAGDHTLVIGRVQQGEVRSDSEHPLIVRMTPWSYG
jgi:flavin reductase (DIM6/NTAB) family NADH-FMN oxidoreductase RutF